MACRGLFLALDATEVAQLLAATSDSQLREVISAIEEKWDEDNLAECDKSWDAMHRLLSDGSLEFDGGQYPLNRFVLSEKTLFQKSGDLACLKSHATVVDIASAAATIDEKWFAQKYWSLVPKNYSPNYGEDDCGYTWAWFGEVRNLYVKAAERGHSVLFSVYL